MSSETTRTVIRHWFSTFDPACACPANFEGGICDGRGCYRVKQELCSLGHWHDMDKEFEWIVPPVQDGITCKWSWPRSNELFVSPPMNEKQ